VIPSRSRTTSSSDVPAGISTEIGVPLQWNVAATDSGGTIGQDRGMVPEPPMPVPAVSRRWFLAVAGAGTVLGPMAILLASCGGADSESTESSDPSTSTAGQPDVIDGVSTDEFAALAISMGFYASDVAARPAQRLPFVIIDQATGAPIRPGSVTVAAIAPLGEGAALIPYPTSAFVPATFHGEGLAEGGDEGLATDGAFVVELAFDRPGPDADPWWIWVEADGLYAIAPLVVKSEPDVVAPGDAAPTAASPTITEPLGADPVCTRLPDICPLHEHSLSDLVGQGRPVVAMFSTPARCTTRVCGPTLELLLAEMATASESVDFVHVEIYQNLTSNDLIPTVDAWALPSDPWLFGIDPSGTIVVRMDGIFDQADIRAVIAQTAATATT
jgi:hypothetical protein